MFVYMLCVLEISGFKRLQEVPAALSQVSFKRVSLDVEAANLLPKQKPKSILTF